MIIDIVLGEASGRGGLEYVLSCVAMELQERGHQVRMFQFHPPEHREWLLTIPTMYYYDPFAMNYETRYDQEISVFRQSLGYRKLVLELGSPDVVLATHTPLFSLLCRLALASMADRQPPIISWIHGPVEAYGGGEVLKYADAHLAISEGVGTSIKGSVGENVPLYYVGNPIDTSKIKRIERPTDSFEIIYVGRLENTQKRLDVLLQSLSRIQGDFRLRVYGDGPDMTSMQSLANQLDLSDRVCWMGWKEDPWEEIDSASVLVLSSDYEGFGMVLVEALARGVPVLSTNCAGPDEIVVPEKNGWLFQPGSTEELSNLLQQLVDGSTELPTQDACESSVKRYRKEYVVDQIEASLHQVRALVSRKSRFEIRQTSH